MKYFEFGKENKELMVMLATLFLMIWAAVALVQEKKLFTTAPKDIQAAWNHPERFPRAKVFGSSSVGFC